MRWTLVPIAFLCLASSIASEALAAPVFDDQRGTAKDTLRDFQGIDTFSSLTTGVANDASASLARLVTPGTLGTLLTQPYEPLSAGAWRKLYLKTSAAAANDIALEVYDSSGTSLGVYPLTPSAQPGFTVEANLASISLVDHPGLRFLVTLDGVGAPFAPVLDDLMVTWQPVAQLDVTALVSAETVCANDTFTIDVPVSVSYVRADQLTVRISAPTLENATHPAAPLTVVSVNQNGLRNAGGSLVYDELTIASGDVYWRFTQPVAAGSSFVLSVTYRLPLGVDNHALFRTRVAADASNAALQTSADITVLADAAAHPAIAARYTTLYSTPEASYANPGTTIGAVVRVENQGSGGNRCDQTMHDVIVVDDLAAFAIDGQTALDSAPTAISNSGVFVPAGSTASFGPTAVNGPAVVWIVPTLPPSTSIDFTYSFRIDDLAPTGALPHEGIASRTARMTSRFDKSTASNTGVLTIGLPDDPNGIFGVGQSFRGSQELGAGRDDLGSLVVPSGEAFGWVLHAENRGLSELRDVYMFLQIPVGLTYEDTYLDGTADVFYTATGGSNPSDSPPAFTAGLLGGAWTNDPILAGNVRWVAVRADLVSKVFGNGGQHTVEAEILVSGANSGSCVPAAFTAKGLGYVGSYVPVGDTTPIANPAAGLIGDDELVNTAPEQPRIHDFKIDRSVAERVGAGPIDYTIKVANDGSSIDPIDVARDVVLNISLPLVELGQGPAFLTFAGIDAADGVVDLGSLASGTIVVRWPTIAPRTTRDVKLTLYWPPGGLDKAVATLGADLTMADDTCDGQFVSGSATTSLNVQPALVSDKVADLDNAEPGATVRYRLTARNVGQGAATDAILFDRIPNGLVFDHVVDPGLGGIVYVSNAQPPLLPAAFTNLAQFDKSLATGALFVPATSLGDGTWTSPFGANTTWVAIELDDHSLTPPRLSTGIEVVSEIVVTVGPLPSQTIVANRSAVDATRVLAAVGPTARTQISGRPVARVTRLVPSDIAAGETMTYTVSVTNTGSSPATSFQLAETLPNGLTLVSSSFAWNEAGTGNAIPTPTQNGQTLTWNLAAGGSLGSLQGGTVTLVVQAASTLASGSELVTQANTTIANAAYPTPSTTVSTSSTFVSAADLAVAVATDQTSPVGGDVVQLTVQIDNVDRHFASDVGFTVRVPPELGYAAASAVVTTPGYTLVNATPTVTPIIEGGTLVGYDLTWTDAVRYTPGPTAGPIGEIPGNSGVAIKLGLLVAPGTPPATELPVTVTATTTTGQGDNLGADVATVTLRTPYADPMASLRTPSFARPTDTIGIVVAYGDDSRQPAGPTAVVVGLPHDGGALTSTFVSATPRHGETLYYASTTVGTTPAFDPNDPAAGGWVSTPSALTGPVTHLAIYTLAIAGGERRELVLRTNFVSPDGDLAPAGSHHDVCVDVLLLGQEDESTDNNGECKDIPIPNGNLTASLIGTPSGTSPGVAVGQSITNTLTLANTGISPIFGNRLTFDPGQLAPTGALPAYVDIVTASGGASTALGIGGQPITQRVPLTHVGDTYYLGTNTPNDPLYYRNLALNPGDRIVLTLASLVPTSIANDTDLTATLVVASDHETGWIPGSSDPEDESDNTAVFAVTAYRPDLLVDLHATDSLGNTNPVRPGERVTWTASYDNLGGIAADQVTLVSSVAAGAGFVVGSLRDIPAGFTVDYFGPSGWGYTPIGGNGATDPAVSAIRLTGEQLTSPVTPAYTASPAALASGLSANTHITSGHVAATTGDGDTWSSEIIGGNEPVQQWTRVQFAGRGGNDPLVVKVLDGLSGQVVSGYEAVTADSSNGIDISGISANAHPTLRFVVTFGGKSPVCDLTSGKVARLDTGDLKVAQHVGAVDVSRTVATATRHADASFEYNPRQFYDRGDGTWAMGDYSGFGDAYYVSDRIRLYRGSVQSEWWEPARRALTVYENVDHHLNYVGAAGTSVLNSDADPAHFLESDNPSYPTLYNERANVMTATAVGPKNGYRTPFLYRYYFGQAPLGGAFTELPTLRNDVDHDFGGNADWFDDVLLGRERGGALLRWTWDGSAWSVDSITAPDGLTSEPSFVISHDTRVACVDYDDGSGNRVAYSLRADGPTPLASFAALPSGGTSTSCVGYVGAGVFTGNRDGVLVAWVPDGAEASGYRIEALPGSPPADARVAAKTGGGLFAVGDDTNVWAYRQQSDGSFAGGPLGGTGTLVGVDTQNVVYRQAGDDISAWPIDSDGTCVGPIAIAAPGWTITDLRRLGDSSTFVGVRAGEVTTFAVLTFDRQASSVTRFATEPSYRDVSFVTRYMAGKTVVGSYYPPEGQRPAVWTANGEGPDGWGFEAIPVPPEWGGVEGLGINKAGNVVYANSNVGIVSFVRSAVGVWEPHDVGAELGIGRLFANNTPFYSTDFGYQSQAGEFFNVGGGFGYFDSSSASGIRVIPSVSSASLQTATGRPFGVSYGPVVHEWVGDVLTHTDLSATSPGYVNDVSTALPIMTGDGNDNVGRVWERIGETWVSAELPGSLYGILVSNTGAVLANTSNGYAIYRKGQAGWVGTRLSVDVPGFSPQSTTSIGWSDNRDSFREDLLYGRIYEPYVEGQQNHFQQVVWETAAPLGATVPFEPIMPRDHSIYLTFFLAPGVIGGSVSDASNNNIGYWYVARGSDGTWTSHPLNASLSSQSNGNVAFNLARPANLGSYAYSDYGLFIWTDDGPILREVFPAPMTQYSNAIHWPYAEGSLYGYWAQGQIYGCYQASDATFEGFGVGYRTGIPATFSFDTQVLADTCQSELTGTLDASSETLDSNTANDSASASIDVLHSELAVTATASHAVATNGTELTWTVRTTNSGPAAATQVMLGFVAPGLTASMPETLGAIPAGQTVTRTYSVTLAGLTDGEVIGASANIWGNEPDCNENDDFATATTVISDQPNVFVALAAPTLGLVGQAFPIVVTYGNNSAASTSAGTIAVSLPAGLAVQSGSATINVSALAPGETGTDTLIVVADASLLGVSTLLAADATVTGDLIEDDNHAEAPITFQDAGGQLFATLLADRGSVATGDQLGLTVFYDNRGVSSATDTTVSVTLPAGLDYVVGSIAAGAGTPVYNAGTRTLTWPVGELLPGQHGAVTVTVVATANGAFTPTAIVDAAADASVGNVASTSVLVANDGVRVATAVDHATAKDGGLGWTITVTNDTSSATTADVAYPLPPGTAYVAGSIAGPGADATNPANLAWTVPLAPGESATLRFVTTVPAATGVVAAAADGNGDTANATGAMVSDAGMPALVTTWDIDWVLPGELAHVTIAYTNPGSALADATLYQSLGPDFTWVDLGGGSHPGGQSDLVAWPLGTLAAGASGTRTFTLQVGPDANGPLLLDRARLVATDAPQQVSNVLMTVALPCSDDHVCTGDADAVPNLGCVFEPAADGTACGGDDPCVISTCQAGTCVGTPNTCEDGNACTTDVCIPNVGCNHASVSCDDGIDCTVDVCSPLGGCANDPSDGACPGTSACAIGVCNPGDPAANPTTGCIVTTALDGTVVGNDVPCGGDACGGFTGSETCQGGQVVSTCDPAYGDVPDTVCANQAAVAYAIVYDQQQRPVGTVRCAQGLGGAVACDESSPGQLRIYDGLFCPGIEEGGAP